MILNKLLDEIHAVDSDAVSVDVNGIVHDIEGNEIQDRPAIAAVIAAHDPVDYVEVRRQAAKDNFKSSALAEMTIGEAETWIDDNIKPGLTAAQLIVALALALKHIVRMILAIRDWTMADIRGQQQD
jgi:hypothetical protein